MNEDMLSMGEESDWDVCSARGAPRFPDDVRLVGGGQPLPEDIPLSAQEHKRACVQAVADSLRLLMNFLNPIELNFHMYKMLKYLKKVKQKNELESLKSEVSSSYYNRMGLAFNTTNMNNGIACGDETRSAFSRGFSRMEGASNISRLMRPTTVLPHHVPPAPAPAPAPPVVGPAPAPFLPEVRSHPHGATVSQRSHRRPSPSLDSSVDTRKHNFDSSDATIGSYVQRDDEDDDRQMMQHRWDHQRPAAVVQEKEPVKQAAGYSNISIVSHNNNTLPKSLLSSTNTTQTNNALMSKLSACMMDIDKNKKRVNKKVTLDNIPEEENGASASGLSSLVPQRPSPPKQMETKSKQRKRRLQTEIVEATEPEPEPEKKGRGRSKKGANQQQPSKTDSKSKTEQKTNLKKEQKSKYSPKPNLDSSKSNPEAQNSSGSKSKAKSAEPECRGSRKRTGHSPSSKSKAEPKPKKAPAKTKAAGTAKVTATKTNSRAKKQQQPESESEDGDAAMETENNANQNRNNNAMSSIFEGFNISGLSLEGNPAISPGAVLNSAKKCCAEDICGRQTPPTAIFGRVFGINDPAGHYSGGCQSIVEDRPANRKQLVQRVSKEWKGAKKRKGNKKGAPEEEFLAPPTGMMVDCDDPEVERIMAAARSTTLRTPTILKQIFRNEDKKKNGDTSCFSSSSDDEDGDSDDT